MRPERCTPRRRGSGRAGRPGWPGRRLGGAARPARGQRALGATADSLLTFVTELRVALGPPGRTRRWSEWADWCIEQTERWIGSTRLERLPEAEYRAYEALTSALDRLRHLDPVGAPVTRHRFRSALESELDAMPGRVGRVGRRRDGGRVGRCGRARHRRGDRGRCGRGHAAAAPDERSAAHRCRTGRRRAPDVRRPHAAAAPGPPPLADTAELTFTVPRGDLRSTAHVEPSRWLDRWTPHAHTLIVDSHTAGLAATVFPVSPTEHRLRARSTHVRAGGDLVAAADVAADVVLSRALTMTAARRGEQVSAFDGDLSSAVVPPVHGVLSPSQLELWVELPPRVLRAPPPARGTDRGAGRPDQHHGERHRHHAAPGPRPVPPCGHRR